MQILWKKYSKENFEVNVDECGIEQGIPGFGYKYEVHAFTYAEICRIFRNRQNVPFQNLKGKRKAVFRNCGILPSGTA